MSKRSLTLSVALAPLCALAMGEAAFAAQSISTGRTTPIATSTVNAGAPDDVNIEAAGSITLTTAGPAVTIDSSNNVTNAGNIKITDVNGAAGVLIKGGNTGSFTNAAGGVITVNETYVATDTVNTDGIVEAPYAQGAGRYGVRLVGPLAFTGNIVSAGSIAVQGNNSYALSIEAPLLGSIAVAGLGLSGDNGAALNIAGAVSGAVTVNGAVTVTGQNSTGIAVGPGADIGGRLSIYSTVSSTGYTTSTRATDPVLTAIQNTPADVQQGGPGVSIAANVAGGVLLGGPPASTVVGSTADLDADGVPDGSAGAGSVKVSGSAPGIQIGGGAGPITLGAVGTGLNNYGLIIRGAVSANGLYDNISSTGIWIGAPGVGGVANPVTVAGGARIVGSVVSTAYNANTTALRIGALARVPELRNDGEISSAIAASTGAATAYGVLIDAGANVSTLTNIGSIAAAVTGNVAGASAVVDNSGTLSNILNQGSITAAVTPTTPATTTAVAPVATGSTIALDLRNNTTGVTLVQNLNPNPDYTYGSVSGTAQTAVQTVTAVAPSITGDIILGSGPNTVQFLSGSVFGALNFGNGNSTLLIDGGATYSGAMTHGTGTLGINVVNGMLQNTTTGPIALSSLSVGAAGALVVTADPANNTATRYNVAGTATLASGVQIGVGLKSLLATPQNYTIISATTLAAPANAAVLSSVVPYLYTAGLTTTPGANGSVILSLRRRTSAELGLNRSEAAAADAIYAALPRDASVQSAALQQTNYAGLAGLYDQLLPEHSGGVFIAAQMASEAVARAAAEPDVAEAGGMWASEIAYGMEQSKGVTSAFQSSGFGVVGGLEADSDIGSVGVTASFVTGRTADNTLPGNNFLSVTQIQGGLYWRGQYRGLTLDASVGGGYASFKSNRELIVAASTAAAAIDQNTSATWSGYSMQGRFGAAYEARSGRFYLRPQAHADYFRLHENAHAETGGGGAFNLTYDERNGSALSATASVVAGMTFGSQVKWRPQVEVGYRTVMSGDAGDTVARFAGGSAFTLQPTSINGSGPVARVAIVADADYLRLVIEAGVQKRKKLKSGDVRASVRARF